MNDTHLVVSSPPHQGSVLGRIVAESRLGQLLARWIAFRDALDRAIAELRAERIAQRSLHKLSEFTSYESAPIDREDEPLFSLTADEYLERFPHSYVVTLGCDGPIIRTGRADDFLSVINRLRLINHAEFASKLREARADSRRYQGTAPGYTTRFALTVRYRKLEKATTNDEERKLEKARSKNAELKADVATFLNDLARKVGCDADWSAEETDRAKKRHELAVARAAKPVLRTAAPYKHTIEVPFGPIERSVVESGRAAFCLSHFGKLLLDTPTRVEPIKVSPKDYATRHNNDEAVTVPHLPNFCSSCLMWVTKLHDHAQCAVKAAQRPTALTDDRSDWSGSGYGPIGLNHMENRFIAVLDAEKRRETEGREKRRKSSHLAAKQAEMRVRAKVRARGKARRKVR